jgi:hypothetical protein
METFLWGSALTLILLGIVALLIIGHFVKVYRQMLDTRSGIAEGLSNVYAARRKKAQVWRRGDHHTKRAMRHEISFHRPYADRWRGVVPGSKPPAPPKRRSSSRNRPSGRPSNSRHTNAKPNSRHPNNRPGRR